MLTEAEHEDLLAARRERDRLREQYEPQRTCVPRIYIAGPMTGIPDQNYPAFHAAAERLRADGYWVVNPAEINVKHPGCWYSAMRADIQQLVTCEAIALLPGWENSRGATLEHHIAQNLGMWAHELNGTIAPVQLTRASEGAQA
jgi:hypothetical protein